MVIIYHVLTIYKASYLFSFQIVVFIHVLLLFITVSTPVPIIGTVWVYLIISTSKLIKIKK